MRKLCWHQLCPAGEAVHVCYSSRSTGGSWEMHGHDFCEVFWVESGIGSHFIRSMDSPQRLISGQLCFIREQDCHAFRAEPSHEPFACINVAFPGTALARIQEVYALHQHPFLRPDQATPPLMEVPAALREEFSRLFFRLLRRPTTALSRDAFLLTLANYTGGIDRPAPPGNLPAWFRRGMLAFEADPQAWKEGSSALARHCDCSPTHLARVFRSHLGQTPTTWIQDLRLVRAARLLSSTGFSVTDVAYESGFENLSYFHRCFARRYGQTPLHFRKSTRREAM